MMVVTPHHAMETAKSPMEKMAARPYPPHTSTFRYQVTDTGNARTVRHPAAQPLPEHIYYLCLWRIMKTVVTPQ